jgi:UDP-glucose-4-epimerase GalE
MDVASVDPLVWWGIGVAAAAHRRPSQIQHLRGTLMRVVVTGGAGYIGSFVVRELYRQRHEVLVVDNLSAGHAHALDKVPLDVIDIRDQAGLDDSFARFGPDAVIHCAALKSARESIVDPIAYYEVNLAGTVNVLRSATAHDVPRLVFSSSCAVYGSPVICPVTEDDPIAPISPYGDSKAACERLVHWHANTTGMSCASLRYFNVAGAALDGSLGEHVVGGVNSLMTRAILAVLGRGPACVIFGDDYPTPDGTALRDYIHVEDLARAHVRVLQGLADPARSGVYNLGRGTPISVREVLSQVQRVSGRHVPQLVGQRCPGDVAANWSDGTKARTVFDWSPRLTLEDMVRSAWDWHRSRTSVAH